MFLWTNEFCSCILISIGISSTIPWTEIDPSGFVLTVVPGGKTLSPIETDPSGFFVTLVPAGRDVEPEGEMCLKENHSKC